MGTRYLMRRPRYYNVKHVINPCMAGNVQRVFTPEANPKPANGDRLGRSVADNTGLTGIFDIHLKYIPEETFAGAPSGQACLADSQRLIGPSVLLP
jgi:hypothetical protein